MSDELTRQPIESPPRYNAGIANLKSWKPGQSGNPKGRPSLATEIARVMAETCPLSGVTKTRMTALALVRLAWNGSVAAHQLIADRLDGRVPTEVNVTVEARELNASELDSELERLREQREMVERELKGIELASKTSETPPNAV